MTLKQAILLASERIQSGLLKNEAQVKQAVIVPILRELGWDDANPEEFRPEHQVDDGLVDYALFVHKKPQVFVEAKRLGNLSAKAEEQLFNYANNRGIPLLVLTDGSIWDFYLSMAAGEPANRRFCRIELDAEAGSLLLQHEESFRSFLGKEQVASGQAKRDAEALHDDTKRRAQANSTIPDAWECLLDPPDELLIELLAEKVEGMCGIRPRDEDVKLFFNQLHSAPARHGSTGHAKSTSSSASSPKLAHRTPSRGSSGRSRKVVGYRLRANEFRCSSAFATLEAILKDFQERDHRFLHHLYDDPRNRGRTTVFVSQERGELYPVQRSDAAYREIGGGWWVGTKLGIPQVIQKIELACEVAGVEFGTELTLLQE